MSSFDSMQLRDTDGNVIIFSSGDKDSGPTVLCITADPLSYCNFPLTSEQLTFFKNWSTKCLKGDNHE